MTHFDLVEASQRVLAFDTLAQVAYSGAAKQELLTLLGSWYLLHIEVDIVLTEY